MLTFVNKIEDFLTKTYFQNLKKLKIDTFINKNRKLIKKKFYNLLHVKLCFKIKLLINMYKQFQLIFFFFFISHLRFFNYDFSVQD